MWPAGRRRPGHRWKQGGGARSLDRLRGRGRILDDAADITNLGRTRTDPGRPGSRTVPATFLHCWSDLLKPGERSRLIYRPKWHTDHRQGGRRSFAWSEYLDQLIAAHQQLGGPIVLVQDNLNVHKDGRMRGFIDTHNWVAACHLPPYAPDLNPVESIWPLLRRTCQANTAFTDADHLIPALRHELRQLQYRSDIIDRSLAETGLKLTTPRLQAR
ncbi:transposase [Streptomyces celluloflavus]